MNSKVLSFVNKMEGWKTAIKSLHWDASNMSQHKLCDDIADRLADFQDQVSEVEQSITGKLPLNKLKGTDYEISNLKGFVEDMINDTTSFLKSMGSAGDKYIGMRSDCESFLSDMQRNLYLVDFTMKEDVKRRIIGKINEAKPKNLANVDTIDKFMGRRPKTMKARINQIYRIVKKYGVDSRIYSDDHWQAISDYYDAITSLGCEVYLKPCGHIENADSIESDGGYCDYDPNDNMPRSKQYAITISFEDGMEVSGYIKCMAAGTVDDPFCRYDTCMVLWPKSNKVLESKMIREYYNSNGNLDDPISHYSNNVPDLGGDKTRENNYSWNKFNNKAIAPGAGDFMYNIKKSEIPHDVNNALNNRNKENFYTDHDTSKRDEFMNNWVHRNGELPMENRNHMKYNLTENELKQVVKEAAIKLIREYGENVSRIVRASHGRGKLKTGDPRKDKENREVWVNKSMEKLKKKPKNESIEIKPENKGKFTATKKATGKSTEELTHSKNPLTRKRANFAKMAKRHWKPLKDSE